MKRSIGPATRGAAVVFLFLTCGCGGKFDVFEQELVAPNGGEVVPALQRKCVIEIVKNDGNEPQNQELKIYFYKTPRKADTSYVPLEVVPSNVVLRINEKTQLPFETVDDAAVAQLGSIKLGRSVQGTLTFDLDGDEAKVILGER